MEFITMQVRAIENWCQRNTCLLYGMNPMNSSSQPFVCYYCAHFSDALGRIWSLCNER